MCIFKDSLFVIKTTNSAIEAKQLCLLPYRLQLNQFALLPLIIANKQTIVLHITMQHLFPCFIASYL